MLLAPSPNWYSENTNLSGKLTSTHNELELSKQLLEKDSEEYERSQSDRIFIQKIISSGTTADKLSTLTLLAQQSPVHNTKALQALVNLGQKKSRSEALKALRAFADWWSAGGAPDRKLRNWIDQPTKPTSDAQRILFYFEDWLKKLFWNVLQTLERLSLDPLPYVRTQATTLIHALLSAKPEQEHNLLRLLVNKLGDSSKTLASRASYHILQLLGPHPAMKSVIVSEIASLILRAPLSTSAKVHVEKDQENAVINSHARYYATITLNQLVLSHSEQESQLARGLIQIYFDMFNFILRVEEQSSREGENEDGPERVKGRTEMKKDKEKRKRKEDRAGKVVKKGDEAFVEVEHGHERFVSAILTGLHRAVPYAALDASGFEKYTNTLFKLTHGSTFNNSLQAMLLIQSLLSCAPQSRSVSSSKSDLETTSNIQSRFLRTLYSSLYDPRLRTSSKKSLYLNLLLKAMNRPYHSSSALAIKFNASEPVVRCAFWRRLIAVSLSGVGVAGENEVVCGSMYILGEIQSRAEELRKIGKEAPVGLKDKENAVEDDAEYDPRKREPEYSKADATPIWELSALANHYHPSASLHARQLLEGRAVTANADLSLNTLSHFLDRFVYKNPKTPSARGTSAMQPSASLSAKKHARERGVWVGEAASVESTMNEEMFRTRKVGSVPADQIFFHKFFSKKHEVEKLNKQISAKKNGSTVDEGDYGSVGSGEVDEDEEQEGEIWKAMQATMPRVDEDEDLVDEDDTDLEDPISDEEFSAQENDGDEVDGDGFDFEESAADLLDSDAELPDDLLLAEEGAISGDEEEGVWGGIGTDSTQKRKANSGRSDPDDGKKKRRKLKHLPTFASFEEYEKLIDQTPEDNI